MFEISLRDLANISTRYTWTRQPPSNNLTMNSIFSNTNDPNGITRHRRRVLATLAKRQQTEPYRIQLFGLTRGVECCSRVLGAATSASAHMYLTGMIYGL